MRRHTLRPLPDLPCKAVAAFPGASGPSRALARGLIGMAANKRDRAHTALRPCAGSQYAGQKSPSLCR